MAGKADGQRISEDQKFFAKIPFLAKMGVERILFKKVFVGKNIKVNT
jgi:hypothetical protein